ncbi:hypothetical protein JYU29_08330 [Tianweitania sp. BSSL-BM11]|uniref:Uncharacterized protein n=1 Tax=Tianweitania aestuarii TaxID=2814886 RepID=A0ABS5RUF9_9HYPH|nr:hypothetical protein [Tianweitania aestuarii]MBS9720690.1 hypothetical protein [Tianweitania aestuarii]
MTRPFRLLPFLGLALAIGFTGCQSKAPQPKRQPSAAASTKSAALRNMEQVAKAAHRCWFASKDPAFRSYSFANELNNFSGRPRFLLVPHNDYGGRPLLVVQAEGAAGKLDTFGPLLDQPLGNRISGDITRWSSGDQSCASSA